MMRPILIDEHDLKDEFLPKIELVHSFNSGNQMQRKSATVLNSKTAMTAGTGVLSIFSSVLERWF